MSPQVKRVVVTGGAGQIAYNLLFRIASGEMLGWDQPLVLSVLDIPPALNALEGVKMELEDCAFPLLKEIRIGTDPLEIFSGADYALLVGAKPRGPGMERGDLLMENAKIFVEQGKALNEVANPDCQVLVVGNPCNTNAWIVKQTAKNLDPRNIYAMTRLDHNRARALLAQKAACDLKQVDKMTIWGNHSATQVPDFFHAEIEGKPATERIDDRTWLEGEFISTVQKRGAAIIKARGKSSAASAANAAIGAIQSFLEPTPWFSSGVYSKDNPYGIDPDLFFSFPCKSDGKGQWSIIEGLSWDPFLEEKIRASEKELIEERKAVASHI